LLRINKSAPCLRLKRGAYQRIDESVDITSRRKFMAISINSNLASVRQQRLLSQSSDSLNRVYEKLSSGQRVNRASDDAAGLAIAASLRSNTRVASTAIRNAQNAVSTLSVADGALESIQSLLGRLSELAAQSANGTYSTVQRSALQSEFSNLGSEIERIAVTTEFNGVSLLSGSRVISFQIGFDGASTSRIALDQQGGATLQALGLAAAGTSALTYSISGTTTDYAQSAAQTALAAISSAVVSLSSLRGTLGSVESRLNSAVQNLTVTRENSIAAESRIMDTDVDSEAAELTRLNILQQAGAAVLSQANQAPQLAIQLLR
jgi:flagellin